MAPPKKKVNKLYRFLGILAAFLVGLSGYESLKNYQEDIKIDELYLLSTLIRQYELTNEAMELYVKGDLEKEEHVRTMEYFREANYQFNTALGIASTDYLEKHEEQFTSIFSQYWQEARNLPEDMDTTLLELRLQELQDIYNEIDGNQKPVL